MAKHVITTIRYDGPALEDHQMDVQALAPALLALAEMVQLANLKLNGDAASMKVLVKADVEQRCFQLDIHIVQSIVESAKHLFGTEQYKTAKEIAELLDLLLPGGVAGGVFWFWKRFSTAKDAPPIALETEQHGGQTTIIQGADGAPITVNQTTYLLASDPQMIELGKKVLKPLERPGYETLGFYRDEKPTVEWNAEEAREFIAQPPTHLLPAPEPDPYNRTPIRAIVSVRTQRNEGKAQWEIKWASRAVWASMEDLEWLGRFQSGQIRFDIPYWLDVEMEMTTSRIDPDAEPSFAIKKVHDLVNGADGKQGDLLGGDEV
ncbi:MAG: hypothetical protein KKA44_17945 [Alphaproteobacteria bacterium]|uniref:Uncharacterized protein n=1 Tax=viral metagenome TaxID=1070528 RepID=A0A6M3LV27_9ZZZZ|nr:hypothetical protein [Alphaproteobacteria bacterium]MBU0865058.1 hypothetical protein [Alphaproteobacteria bacterium]MBU1826836.1 hypothetical protein [Alphaproteobacteria bacterium]